MGLSHSRHTSRTSPPRSQLDFPEVARSFHASFAKLQEFVTEDANLASLATEVDLSSFWTAFEERSEEHNRELVVLVTWGKLITVYKRETSYEEAVIIEMEEIANGFQAGTDVLDLMYRRLQER